MNEALAEELLAMAAEDKAVRAELAAAGVLFAGYHPRMAEVHRVNARRLETIIDAHGWPGRRLVGEAAAEAAWLVLQHAVADPPLQRRGLVALVAAAERGEVAPWQPAMLEDRIRVLEGRLQRYGTQHDWNADGELGPLPLEDPAGVDERRHHVGLPPLADVTRELRERAAREGERPPADPVARRRDQDAWARATGWRR